MNEINGNLNYNYGNYAGGYNYKNYDNGYSYGNYPSLGYQNIGYQNQSDVGSYLKPISSSKANESWLNKVRDGAIIGGLTGVSSRIWNATSALTTNFSRGLSRVSGFLGGVVGFLSVCRDAESAMKDDREKGRDFRSINDGTFLRELITSSARNGAAASCGAIAGIGTALTGVGAFASAGVGAAAGSACYYVADKLVSEYLDEKYPRTENYIN
ncbi:MAG: hypothetical protein ACOX3T_04100 [Bdellovibrionota bacterium]